MGVKSLWDLLTPVGRPVALETMEGKAMAIDSSIWIYQFQATMRDKEGRGLVNAHVLGFLRRISKLLFYGIKPVFVFDGGAPALKRATITERKNKKAGAVASHARVAEKLLAAQMRREAVNHAQAHSSGKGKGKAPERPMIDDGTVYLEDIDDRVPRAPPRQDPPPKPDQPSPSPKKARWQDHDPYRLEPLNLSEAIANATRASAPDPRLATEDELRAFIEEMRPEDFDVSSPDFRALPTEVQYEIIGDLRLRSRQTSYKRLQSMLRSARTALDFSKEQIRNLQQRNALTQQLLVTTDSIGKANITIPVRIAAERNRQYVLVKNDADAGGGWILGRRDEGTIDKPIEIDIEGEDKGEAVRGEDDEDSDMDMEEVTIPPAPQSQVDPDLRDYRRGQALSAIARRYSPKKLAPLTTKPPKPKKKTQPLFAADDEDVVPASEEEESDDDDDMELVTALQESAAEAEELDLQRALEASKSGNAKRAPTTSRNNAVASSSRTSPPRYLVDEDDDDDDLYVVPNRLETALSIGGAGPSRRVPGESPKKTATVAFASSAFGAPSLLLEESESAAASVTASVVESDDDADMEEIVPTAAPPLVSVESRSSPLEDPVNPVDDIDNIFVLSNAPPPASPPPDHPEETVEVQESGEASQRISSLPLRPRSTTPPMPSRSSSVSNTPANASTSAPVSDVSPVSQPSTPATRQPTFHQSTPAMAFSSKPEQPEASGSKQPEAQELDSSDEEELRRWSRSPSPVGAAQSSTQARPGKDEGWDAAHEMDPHAEEGDFADFVSRVKGRDLDSVRREIDDEIRVLNQQKKAAMRDSEDITHQMVSQIMMMLRLFGIPYITAPMEAEAQCAALTELGLVDGIITDDSDVFLFGGARVLKNMFNQSKTVECFLLPDLARELGLDRDTLVRLAYLLGSDYTPGLPGVGPVAAMELLREFPGADGLHRFRAWWRAVQVGRDRAQDSASKFRKRFKKKFKDSLHLTEDWPNPAVRDAYYHPTVDESDEPFKWGLPDLDALRGFLDEELGWSQAKTDDLLLPIIHKVSKRGQAAALNRQDNLNDFFSISGASGSHAPRKRKAYASKRLQQIVSEFRSEQAKLEAAGSQSAPEADEGDDDEIEAESSRPQKKRRASGTKTAAQGAKKAPRGKTRGRGRGGKTSGRKRKPVSDDSEDEFQPPPEPLTGPVSDRPTRRPRPRPVKKATVVEDGESIGSDIGQ